MIRNIALCFHGIGAPPAGIPADERSYWISENLFASFIADAPSKAKALGVNLLATFDDGNRSDLDIAAPILAKYGLSGTFFPCTGRLARRGYLSEDDLRCLSAMGFQIGSHGVDHVSWTELNTEELNREIVDSKDELEQILGAKVQAAAIPFGHYNRRVLAALKAAGYTQVYNSDRGFGYVGRWQTRRWTYTSEEKFDLESLVSMSNSLGRRVILEVKGIIKALR
ncbi:polysaccharide deacetylase family protein [Bradyrhizobium sp. 182]|uniref:polysaccharide deacetylase family protein n=1 Tax=unclassified Bradyrhizobium TaxID=2631580 RepID=UPI001FF7F58D|nr:MULTISPECIES: polysaccharide deacetylase family protein [unclassified Bradyrhizobium]MCK1424826.1 polysaccharide deacetylase family protein [Bradyrhizobium sp. CW12]MCK1531856.1 polysaccharide deacetylase family protein [Bradyrhizobium sp. 182]MCK1646507.1 polysaccharide deacetylase family protein [Bradyrhizobium sp. 154]